MKQKNIKVSYSTQSRTRKGAIAGTTYIETPKISFEGKWLEELGFHTGDKIQILYDENGIHILPANKPYNPILICESISSYIPK